MIIISFFSCKVKSDGKLGYPSLDIRSGIFKHVI